MEIASQNKRAGSVKEIIERADIGALKKLYDQAENDLVTIVNAMEAMNRTGNLSPMQNENGINAMRDVALAAIELAKNVATKYL